MPYRSPPRGLARATAVLVAAWAVASSGGAAWLVRQSLDERRAAFETDARIVHRVLSQRVVQHDAMLSTLALLQPAGGSDAGPAQRLPALYPQVLRVLRREGEQPWTDDAALAAALVRGETASRQAGRAALGPVDFATGRYWLVRAAEPASFALQIDLRSLPPGGEWPLPEGGAARAGLVHEGQTFVLAPGRPAPAKVGHFDFAKHLAADSQPFDVQLALDVGAAQLPWGAIAAWAAAIGAAIAGGAAWWRQRADQRRARELLRLGQVGRLNALGELAAGIAHELNQPLTAVMANTGAAQRLLDDTEPDLATARQAMAQASQQARRAADVLSRLRRLIERPQAAGQGGQAVRLRPLLEGALDLLRADLRRLDVQAAVDVEPATLAVQADPVALEQIVHNLLANALQALAQVSPGERRLVLGAAPAAADGAARVRLTVRDNGPGIAADVLPRLFEPFFTTRAEGLGLGLSLCETLALAQGGRLTAANVAPRGAEFTLELPGAEAGS
ncbi:MAG TPA: ATP-binding protein [Burkholderiaceae bacterium]|nr:ATP-binding protein [Burkholderiaceae bacterium]